ncbi:MAG: hypothetical protein ACRDS9_12360 [Pseudonocardiaceae bacterium]
MAKKPKIAAVKTHTAEPAKALAAKPKAAAKARAAAKPAAAAKPKAAAKPRAPQAKAVASSKRMHNSHSDAAQRMMQLAQFLSEDPEEAKVFAKKTGVYTNAGELTAAYR